MQGFYLENYKHHGNKLKISKYVEIYTVVMDQKTKVVKITNLHKLIYRVNANSMKMSADIFWCENQQADLKICVKI